MKRIAWPLVAFLAFAAGLAWPMATAQEPKEAARWEYRIMTFEVAETLNELGGEGWELVTVIGQQNRSQAKAYLKRKK